MRRDGGNAARKPRYCAPAIWSLASEDVRELLGPVESQYSQTTTGASCLPLAGGTDTVQDNWQFAVPAAPTRVTIDVDVTDAQCATATFAACAGLFTAPFGPLDPKFAVYEPGVTPAAGPFNGFFSPDCTVDPGCATKPADSCIRCDNMPCSDPSIPGTTCGTLDVGLDKNGLWTLSVAPQAPAFVPQGQGCYVVTVSAEAGKTIGALTLVNDDATVTFRPPR